MKNLIIIALLCTVAQGAWAQSGNWSEEGNRDTSPPISTLAPSLKDGASVGGAAGSWQTQKPPAFRNTSASFAIT